MPRIRVRAPVSGPIFQARRAAMLALVTELREREAKVRANSGRAKARFAARGQLTPRERLAALLDPGTPRLELSSLAGWGLHDDDGDRNASGGNVITAIGAVHGTRCVVFANDSGIKAGSNTPMGLRKALRAQQIALENRLPMICLVESAGSNLLYQSESFVEGGRRYRNMARLSAAGVPQIAVVHGPSTAGGAYIPGLADYTVAVRKRAKMYLAGPPLLLAATGEVATEEELGGADMLAGVSGTVEYVAEDDAGALQIARDIVASWGWPADPPPLPCAEPLHDAEELAGLVPTDHREPYDVHEVIARIADGSEFLDYKAAYGESTVCGHLRIGGHACGLIGNNGPITPQGAAKAAQFIQACCQAGLPIIYLQNTTGFLVGREAEAAGSIKHGSKMIQAVANATVPQITIMLGGSFGAGNYGMCGRAFDPRFVFAWPNARISVMGPEQAGKVLALVTEAKWKREGTPVDSEALNRMEQSVSSRIEAESSALYATARLWDDGIIDPRDTRRVLALCLGICAAGSARVLRPSSFGVARM
jgi:geranyl-CoA carboxylase beta subunit